MKLISDERIKRWQDSIPTCDWFKKGASIQLSDDLEDQKAERDRIVEEIEKLKQFDESVLEMPIVISKEQWQSLKSRILKGV